MSLPPLDSFEAEFYLDSMDIYRKVKGPNGNILGYQLFYTGIPVNVHDTPNYDTLNSPAGLAKETNLFTANKFTCQLQADIRATDVVFITTRYGQEFWQSIEGAAKKGSLMPHTFFYGVPLGPNPPTIYVPPNAPVQFIIPPPIPLEIPAFGLFNGLY